MRSKLIITIVTLLAAVQQVCALKPSPRVAEVSRFSRNQLTQVTGGDKQSKSVVHYTRTEVEERILIHEPYKSLIQTTTRFVLVQSGVARHVDIETIIDILNDTGYMLSRPSVLSKATKFATVIVASLVTVVFFFPNSFKLTEEALRNGFRLAKLEQWLPNGINEETIMKTLGSRPEDLIARFGLTNSSCRDLSLCKAGHMLASTFPQVSDSLIKFAKENLSSSKYRENRSIDVFLSGFADKNCAGFVGADEEVGAKQSCVANMFDSFDFITRCRKGNASSESDEQQQVKVVPAQKFQIVKPASKPE